MKILCFAFANKRATSALNVIEFSHRINYSFYLIAVLSLVFFVLVMKTNVYQSTKFFYFILKSLGLASYTFDKKSLSFKITLWNCLELIVSLIFWPWALFVAWLSFHGTKVETGVKSKLLERIWKNQFMLQNFLATLTVIYNFFKRDHVEQYLRLIFNFDKTVKRISPSLQSTHWRFSIVALYLISVSVMIGSYFKLYCFNVEYLEVIRLINSMVLYEFYLMISMQFILSSHYVKVRIESLITLARLVIVNRY